MSRTIEGRVVEEDDAAPDIGDLDDTQVSSSRLAASCLISTATVLPSAGGKMGALHCSSH